MKKKYQGDNLSYFRQKRVITKTHRSKATLEMSGLSKNCCARGTLRCNRSTHTHTFTLVKEGEEEKAIGNTSRELKTSNERK